MATSKTRIELIVEAEVKKAIDDLNKTEKEIDDLAKSGEKAGGLFGGMGKVLAGAFSAAALLQIGRTAFDLAKLGAEAEDVGRAFQRIPQSAELLVDLRGAVRSTVPDLELMRGALQGIDLGASNEQLKTFAEFARLEGVRKGADTLTIFQNILGGVFRGSTELLDNFGFSLGQVNAKIEELARASGTSAEKLGAVERRALLAEAVMGLMRERMSEVGEVTTTASERIRANAAEWDNLKVRVGRFLADAGQGVTDFFTSALGGLNSLLDDIGVGGAERIRELSRTFVNNREAITRTTAEIDRLAARYEELSRDDIQPTREEQEELNRVIARLAEIAPGTAREINEYGQVLDVNIGSVRAFAEAQRQLLKIQEVKTFERIREGIQGNIESFDEATEQLQRIDRQILELSQKKPDDLVPSISARPGPAGEAVLETYTTARERITLLQESVQNITGELRTSSAEFDNLTFALSNFVDLSRATPQSLSAELQISEQQAGKLIERFQELSQVPPLAKVEIATQVDEVKANQAKEAEIKRQQEIARQVRKLRVDELVLSASTEFQARIIALEEQYKMEQEQFQGNAEALEQLERVYVLRRREIQQEIVDFNVAILEERVRREDEILLQQLEREEELRLEKIEKEKEMLEQRVQVYRGVATQIEGSMARFAASIASGAVKASDAWEQFFQDLKRAIIEFLASQAAKQFLKFIGNVVGGAIGVPGLGNLLFAQQGAYIRGSAAGQAVIVGERNTDEVILPVKKIPAFLAGEYKLPGGYSIADIPLPQPGAGLGGMGGGSSFERLVEREVPIMGKIQVETVAPELARVREYYVRLNREVNIPDRDMVDTLLRAGKSEFD